MTEIEEMRERHQELMKRHGRFMRSRRIVFLLFSAFLIFAILYSLQAIITGEPVTLSAEEYKEHLAFIIVIYSALCLVFIGQTAMALRSRAKILQLFVAHFETSFELGRLSALSEDDDAHS